MTKKLYEYNVDEFRICLLVNLQMCVLGKWQSVYRLHIQDPIRSNGLNIGLPTSDDIAKYVPGKDCSWAENAKCTIIRHNENCQPSTY